jgi:hypothetical protein
MLASLFLYLGGVFKIIFELLLLQCSLILIQTLIPADSADRRPETRAKSPTHGNSG